MERPEDAAKPSGRQPSTNPSQQGDRQPPSAAPLGQASRGPVHVFQQDRPAQPGPGASRGPSIDLNGSDVWGLCEGAVRALLREDRALAFFFEGPMLESEAPGFAAATSQPMDFTIILGKLHRGEYQNPGQVLGDAQLIWDNVRAFFRADSAMRSFVERGEERLLELWQQRGISAAWTRTQHGAEGAVPTRPAPQPQQGLLPFTAQRRQLEELLHLGLPQDHRQLQQEPPAGHPHQGPSAGRYSTESRRRRNRTSWAAPAAPPRTGPVPAGATLPGTDAAGPPGGADPLQPLHRAAGKRSAAPPAPAVGAVHSGAAAGGPQLDGPWRVDGLGFTAVERRGRGGQLRRTALPPARAAVEGEQAGANVREKGRGVAPGRAPPQGGNVPALELLRQVLELHASSSEDQERKKGLSGGASGTLPLQRRAPAGQSGARGGAGRRQHQHQGEVVEDAERPRRRRQRRKLADGLPSYSGSQELLSPGDEQQGLGAARVDGVGQADGVINALDGVRGGENSGSGSGRQGGGGGPSDSSGNSFKPGSSKSSESISELETETEGGESGRRGSKGSGSATSSGKGGESRGRGGAPQQPGLCHNCRTTQSYTWRRHPTNRDAMMCLACSMYTYRTGAMRPPEVWQKHQAQRGRKRQCFHCQATQARHWYHHGEDRKDICVICWQYMRRHAGAMRPLEERAVTYDPRPYSCAHCGSTATSSWRAHPVNGSTLCSACHQYMQKHNGQSRPERLWQTTREEQESVHWRRRKRGPRHQPQQQQVQEGADQREQVPRGNAAEELNTQMASASREDGHSGAGRMIGGPQQEGVGSAEQKLPESEAAEGMQMPDGDSPKKEGEDNAAQGAMA